MEKLDPRLRVDATLDPASIERYQQTLCKVEEASLEAPCRMPCNGRMRKRP